MNKSFPAFHVKQKHSGDNQSLTYRQSISSFPVCSEETTLDLLSLCCLKERGCTAPPSVLGVEDSLYSSVVMLENKTWHSSPGRIPFCSSSWQCKPVGVSEVLPNQQRHKPEHVKKAHSTTRCGFKHFLR